jgi:Protein of unknown function (DUF3040)
MSLPGSQQRALDQIERTLLADDRRLGSLFAFFTRLTSHEAMPSAERVTARPRPLRLRVGVAAMIAIGLAAVMSALLLLLLAPGRQACPDGAAPSPAHLEPFRSGQRASCPASYPAGTRHAAAGQS